MSSEDGFDFAGEARVQQRRTIRLVLAHIERDALQQAAVMDEIRDDQHGALVASLALLNALAAGLAVEWTKNLSADEVVAYFRGQLLALNAEEDNEGQKP